MSSLLLIEDDWQVSRMIVRGLEGEGHTVSTASDGHKGLAAVRGEHYDAVILDMLLPNLSGKEICLSMRKAGVSTPILMLTALDAVEDKVDGLRSGADDYMTKPFDFEELLARIEALIRRARGSGTAAGTNLLQFGNVVIDRDARTVRRDGELVDLTAKEFLLLELLMSSPGKAQSRVRLLSKVWHCERDPMTNIVDVYIRRLRIKLRWDPETGPIRMLRGYGYRLDDSQSDSRSPM